jgi:hypothetical protein
MGTCGRQRGNVSSRQLDSTWLELRRPPSAAGGTYAVRSVTDLRLKLTLPSRESAAALRSLRPRCLLRTACCAFVFCDLFLCFVFCALLCLCPGPLGPTLRMHAPRRGPDAAQPQKHFSCRPICQRLLPAQAHVVEAPRHKRVRGAQELVEVVRPEVVADEAKDRDPHIGLRATDTSVWWHVYHKPELEVAAVSPCLRCGGTSGARCSRERAVRLRQAAAPSPRSAATWACPDPPA